MKTRHAAVCGRKIQARVFLTDFYTAHLYEFIRQVVRCVFGVLLNMQRLVMSNFKIQDFQFCKTF